MAGALVAFQKNFTADSNHLAWNGHEADGGTGYGIASMAGSYGFGITYSRNTTDHNYRKGLDIHDGNHITIENNTLNGDRLYGIGVYNRQFTMDDVTIRNNHITADPKFRLATDDGDEIAGGTPNYHLYSGIQIQTNTQPLIQDLQSKGPGKFDISDNTISGLEIYQNGVHTYGIEFRNHEPTMNQRQPHQRRIEQIPHRHPEPDTAQKRQRWRRKRRHHHRKQHHGTRPQRTRHRTDLPRRKRPNQHPAR